MDTRTGDIMSLKALQEELGGDFVKFGREVQESNLSPEIRAALQATGRAKAGRNDPCPCGSGTKFKKCCRAAVRA